MTTLYPRPCKPTAASMTRRSAPPIPRSGWKKTIVFEAPVMIKQMDVSLSERTHWLAGNFRFVWVPNKTDSDIPVQLKSPHCIPRTLVRYASHGSRSLARSHQDDPHPRLLDMGIGQRVFTILLTDTPNTARAIYAPSIHMGLHKP